MNEWMPISEAPRDNTSVVIRTYKGAIFAATWYDYTGFGSQWGADDEGIHPACWTDGLCWHRNEDAEPSDPPVAFMVSPLLPGDFPMPEVELVVREKPAMPKEAR